MASFEAALMRANSFLDIDFVESDPESEFAAVLCRLQEHAESLETRKTLMQRRLGLRRRPSRRPSNSSRLRVWARAVARKHCTLRQARVRRNSSKEGPASSEGGLLRLLPELLAGARAVLPAPIGARDHSPWHCHHTPSARWHDVAHRPSVCSPRRLIMRMHCMAQVRTACTCHSCSGHTMVSA